MKMRSLEMSLFKIDFKNQSGVGGLMTGNKIKKRRKGEKSEKVSKKGSRGSSPHVT